MRSLQALKLAGPYKNSIRACIQEPCMRTRIKHSSALVHVYKHANQPYLTCKNPVECAFVRSISKLCLKGKMFVSDFAQKEGRYIFVFILSDGRLQQIVPILRENPMI